MPTAIATIKQCRFCEGLLPNGQCHRPIHMSWMTPTGQWKCSEWRSGGVLPETAVEVELANAD